MAARAALAVALVAGTFLLTATACHIDKFALWSMCGQYIIVGVPKKPPSDGCCDVVKGTDIRCACSLLAGGLAPNIDMGKVCYVAACCGNALEPGSTCGSYKVPPSCI